MDSALGISLIARVFGHRHCQHLECCTNSSAIENDDLVRSKSRTDQSGRESLPGKLEAQPVEHGGAVIES